MGPPRNLVYRPGYQRGRGSFRGYRNRGTRGRPIPGGLGNDRHSRLSNRFANEAASEAGSAVTFGSASLESLYRNDMVTSRGLPHLELGSPSLRSVSAVVDNSCDSGLEGSVVDPAITGQWGMIGQDAVMEDVGPVASGSGIAVPEDELGVEAGGPVGVADEPMPTGGLDTPEGDVVPGV